MHYIRYFTPSFFNMTPIKHQFVNPDCIKFTPTNTVNHSQLGCTKYASIRLIRIKLPAIKLIYLLIMILNFNLLKFLYVEYDSSYGVIALDAAIKPFEFF